MSHFNVAVLMKHSEDLDVEGTVQEMLAPYDESIQVPEYPTDCWCVGSQCRREVGKIINPQIEAAREEFHVAFPRKTWPSQLASKAEWAKFNAWEEAHDVKWREFIAPILTQGTSLRNNHPLKDSADPTCEECSGSGKVDSTYNPKSKWDWFQIGGRWTGALVEDYDPAEDINNIETCWLCAGTGTRSDGMNGPSGCNGCGGSGTCLKWATQFAPFDRDVLPLNQVKPDFRPFAIVTPDGEWHERGKMGWFGMAHNEKDKDAWSQYVQAVFGECSGCVVANIDCHI